MPFVQPKLDYLGLGQYCVVNEPVYTGRDQKIVVPQGTLTDLASVPRLFWALVPPFGAYEAATVLHDYLCQQQAEGKSPVSSVDADGLFRRVMREGGVGFFTRWVMWTGVRWGALANPARRAGWWGWPQMPLVLLASVLELVVLGFLFIGVHFVIDGIWSLL